MEQHANGQIQKATVVNVNIISGRIQCDVLDCNGNFYTGCEVISPGTGGANGYSNVSIEKNQEVVIIMSGTATSPYILGTTFRSSLTGIQITETAADNSKDYQTISINNDFRKNGLNSINLTKNNGIILNSAQNIRLQLMLGGKLRISAAGQTVDNPLNGQQYIDITTPYFESLSQISQAHTAVIQSIATAMAAINAATATMSAAIVALEGAPLTGTSLGAITTPYATSVSTSLTTLATAAANLTATIAPYLTPEYLNPTTVLKPETEDTLNQKIELPK